MSYNPEYQGRTQGQVPQHSYPMPQAPYPPPGPQAYPYRGPSPQPPQPPHAQQGVANNAATTGETQGLHYSINYRDSNSMLSVRLKPGCTIKAKPGSMVAMDATVQIKGKLKFSLKKMFTGGEMSESTFTGPGEVLLAPETWGDISPITLDGRTEWRVGKDAFLACTSDISRATKAQGIGKALFSGEGLFVYQVTGAGVMWVQSLGGIMSRTLQPGEQWIVDNGHLVAWTAQYKVERIQAGGILSASHTDEGLICRFTGPGTVYIQTRNPETLGSWIEDQIPARA